MTVEEFVDVSFSAGQTVFNFFDVSMHLLHVNFMLV